MSDDMVERPPHYTDHPVFPGECWDYSRLLTDGASFSAFRYLWRYRGKGAVEQDLDKADWYLERLLAGDVPEVGVSPRRKAVATTMARHTREYDERTRNRGSALEARYWHAQGNVASAEALREIMLGRWARARRQLHEVRACLRNEQAKLQAETQARQAEDTIASRAAFIAPAGTSIHDRDMWRPLGYIDGDVTVSQDEPEANKARQADTRLGANDVPQVDGTVVEDNDGDVWERIKGRWQIGDTHEERKRKADTPGNGAANLAYGWGSYKLVAAEDNVEPAPAALPAEREGSATYAGQGYVDAAVVFDGVVLEVRYPEDTYTAPWSEAHPVVAPLTRAAARLREQAVEDEVHELEAQYTEGREHWSKIVADSHYAGVSDTRTAINELYDLADENRVQTLSVRYSRDDEA